MGGYTRNGATIWQISTDKIEAYRESHPELFYRIVSRIAVGINRRLRALSRELHRSHTDAKVNPVIPELVNQICYQVMGYDAVVSMAAEASELELCMAEPIIAYDLLHGMMILIMNLRQMQFTAIKRGRYVRC